MREVSDVTDLNLAVATDDEIIAEVERRAKLGRPVTATCPNCTRRDALLVVWCADKHPGAQVEPLPGTIAPFPLEPRARAVFESLVRPALDFARAKDLDVAIEYGSGWSA